MIVFDTNLILEAIKAERDANVARWLRTLISSDAMTTSVNLAELRVACALQPEGKRKSDLHRNVEIYVATAFGSRILNFDSQASIAFANLSASMSRKGHAISFADAQVAAIAIVHDAIIATRDVLPFRAAGLTVINPWMEE